MGVRSPTVTGFDSSWEATSLAISRERQYKRFTSVEASNTCTAAGCALPPRPREALGVTQELMGSDCNGVDHESLGNLNAVVWDVLRPGRGVHCQIVTGCHRSWEATSFAVSREQQCKPRTYCGKCQMHRCWPCSDTRSREASGMTTSHRDRGITTSRWDR